MGAALGGGPDADEVGVVCPADADGEAGDVGDVGEAGEVGDFGAAG
ncbi:MAG TPA: hypothetical protein VHT26_16110 [Trebonia sp.]|nr:hypothetical protein [Trebonia sp.]